MVVQWNCGFCNTVRYESLGWVPSQWSVHRRPYLIHVVRVRVKGVSICDAKHMDKAWRTLIFLVENIKCNNFDAF